MKFPRRHGLGSEGLFDWQYAPNLGRAEQGRSVPDGYVLVPHQLGELVRARIQRQWRSTDRPWRLSVYYYVGGLHFYRVGADQCRPARSCDRDQA